MKTVLIFMVAVAMNLSCRQRPDTIVNRQALGLDSSTSNTLSIDSAYYHEYFILKAKSFAVTLNEWTPDKPLPKFMRRNLDDEFYNIGRGHHNVESFRKTILDNVNNRELLKMIIESKDSAYRRIFLEPNNKNVPHHKQSLVELATQRYWELVQ